MNVHRPLTGAERVAKRRAALRARGLRPRTFWLPDLTSPASRAQAARDCEYLWRSVPEDEQAMVWIEAMVDEVLTDLDRAEGER